MPFPYVENDAGLCPCGAVYALAVTGYDRGVAFLSALLLAVAGDWDLAWDLIPEEDYQEHWIEGYDLENHLISPDPYYEGRRIPSALVFIKVSEDLQELKKQKLAKALPKIKKEEEERFKVRLKRLEIENLLRKREFALLNNYLVFEPKNLRELQKLLYHPEEEIRYLASYLFGLSAEKLQKRQPARVLDLLKSFLYAGADTATSAWGALPAVGEIIRVTGEDYAPFVKNLMAFLPYRENQTSALYALLRISQKNPKAIKLAPYLKLLPLFREKNPLHQAFIVQIFTNIKGPELYSEKEYLLSEEVSLFNPELGAYYQVHLLKLWETYEGALWRKK